MTDYPSRLQYLYKQFINDLASPEELSEFWQAMDDLKDDDPIKEIVFQQYAKKMPADLRQPLPDWNNALKKILEPPSHNNFNPSSRIAWWRKLYWTAAALIGIVVGGFYMLTSTKHELPQALPRETARYENDIAPGRNGAILTLSDGTTLNLDTAHRGLVAVQGKTKLTSANGTISYEKTHATGNEPLYNTISTPRGRQFKIVLSDGSQVWLNAASSIRYPAVFEGRQRTVQITGEAYFEIAAAYSPDREKIPFVVQFNTPSGYSGEINVLGTHFNVNAYSEETSVKTTLMEGSVKISLDNKESSILQPGQQVGIAKNGKMKVTANADIDAVLAWKNGYFSFDKTDMATLMREISRWYDVEIEYAGAIPDRKFGGEISRNSNASEVLRIMEESKVFFRIESKKIILLP